MLKMAQIQYIKHLYETEDKSLREISRITSHSFNTVKKYAYQDNWSPDNLPNIDPQNYPTLGPFIPIIDEWLDNDRRVPRKQRHTISRIFKRLCDEKGFTGSYSSVKKYVRKKRFIDDQASAGFIPLMQPKTHAQADFGEFTFYTPEGNSRKAYALTVTFPYSNKGYIQALPAQNQEYFLAGLQRIFEHIGGAPQVIRFDNLSAAVVKVLDDGKRVLTDGFSRFMLHYRFKAEFCSPASGNEKGNVENKVGYSRRNALVPIPTISSYDEFNEYLWSWCEKDAERIHYKHKVQIQELWEQEKDSLLVLPENPYSVFRYETVKPNKYGFVCIDTNSYGLRPSLSGCLVQAKIFYDSIEFYYNHSLEARYPRCYEHNKEILDWTKYIGALCKKPGAAADARFFNQLPKLWQAHLSNIGSRERKNALLLLKEIVSDGNAKMCDEALALARENGRTDTDSLRQCYYMIAKRENRPLPIEVANVPELHYDPDLTAYDTLMGGVHNA